jgi:hypothetical protein
MAIDADITSGNYTITLIGGGVYVAANGVFTMPGGTISGNTAVSPTSYGGGIYSEGTFIKQGGGTIDATNSAGFGKAAYVVSSGPKVRNTTAGPTVDLNSDVAGSAGAGNNGKGADGYPHAPYAGTKFDTLRFVPHHPRSLKSSGGEPRLSASAGVPGTLIFS